MSWLNRSSSEVDDRQLANVQADTGSARAADAAGSGRRSIGTSRPEVRTTSGASRAVSATPRR
jgi:hypothetical protein